MADYQPLISKAVTGLDKNTGEARRVLYERARKALVGQLRNMTPPLTESEITRERLALEEAIRKVEAEAARRMRDQPSADGAKPDESMRAGASEQPAPSAETPPAPENGSPAASTVGQGSEPAPQPSPPPPPPPSGASRFFRRRQPAQRSNLSNEGLKGFRDVVAEAEGLGEKTAQGAKSAREAFAALPSNVPEFDRVEPRIEPEGLRGTPREPAAPPTVRAERADRSDRTSNRPSDRTVDRTGDRSNDRSIDRPNDRTSDRSGDRSNDRTSDRPSPSSAPRRGEPRPPTARPPRRGDAPPKVAAPPRSRKGVVAAVFSLIIIFALAVAAIVNRDRIAGFFGAVRGLAPLSREAGPPKPKIPDRVGQDSQQSQSAPAQPSTTAPAPSSGAAVAQRVVLYEEDPAEPTGKRYVGSAIWRTETVSPGPGLASDLAIRCDVEIPERRLAMTLSIRRNKDTALPASHTIEVVFNLPADFPFGGINNVPGILMKQAEQTRGSPLSGLAVKVTSGFFLVGLSSVETEMQRNIELLKERPWFDIPVVYNNGRRAILAIEKGTPGERVFNEAFAAWKQ